MHAGEVIPVQCGCPGWTHGTRGPPPTLQPLWTHPTHTNAHSPLLQSLLWPPPPIQHGDCHGLDTSFPLDRLGHQGWLVEPERGRVFPGWVEHTLGSRSSQETHFLLPVQPGRSHLFLEDSQPCAAITVNISNWAALVCAPGAAQESVFTDSCLESKMDRFIARPGREKRKLFFEGERSKLTKFCSYFLQGREDTGAWAVCVLRALPQGQLPSVRALGGGPQPEPPLRPGG